MVKKNKKKSNGLLYLVGAIVIVIVIVVVLVMVGGGEKYNQEDIDVFAKCLTDSGAIMYGTFWCPHCARTKALFGTSFEFINYVECDARGENEQSELCIEKEIEGYDTWEFSDGSRVIGEPSIETLSEKSGCLAPEVQ